MTRFSLPSTHRSGPLRPARRLCSTMATWWSAADGSARTHLKGMHPGPMRKAAPKRCLSLSSPVREELDKHLVRRTALTLALLPEVSSHASANPLYESIGMLHRSGHRVGDFFRRVFHPIHRMRQHFVGADDLQTRTVEDVIQRTFQASNSRMGRRRNSCGVVENLFHLGSGRLHDSLQVGLQ